MTDANNNFSGYVFMVNVFYPARYILRESRSWYLDLTDKYPQTHPAVIDMIERHNVRPRDWQRLLLEHPHISETDPSRLAYTLDERAGLADRQTITTIGKYLNRHFDAPDHIIRDLTAQHTSTSEFRFIRDIDGMVHAVRNGPHSCMAWSDGESIKCSDGERRHPYAVYDPAYGWHMAVRVDGGHIVGRALCNEEHGTKYYVRSYKRCPNNGYSHADEALEAWLKGQGYEHRGGWHDGAELALHPTCDEFLAPYIDGCSQRVNISNGKLVIDDDGDYECDNTNGTPSGGSREECSCCGHMFDADDMHYIGERNDEQICNGCLDYRYRYAIGRRGNEYYVHEDDVVYVESQHQYYHIDYLDSNGIVELHNGDYEHTDNAVEVDGDWYHNEDDDIVYDEFNECYQLIDNCTRTEDMGYVHSDDVWCCEATDNCYSNNIEFVELDGKTYHPDHVPKTNTQE